MQVFLERGREMRGVNGNVVAIMNLDLIMGNNEPMECHERGQNEEFNEKLRTGRPIWTE